MSTIPITHEAFARALEDLPLENLHAKAAELRNSIHHLQHSNVQLQQYLSKDSSVHDPDNAQLVEAIGENRQTIRRLEERIGLLKIEVEKRGFLWDDNLVQGIEDKADEAKQKENLPLPEPVDGSSGVHL